MRRTLSTILVLVGFAGCAGALGPAEQKEIADTAATIAKCRAEAKACQADGGSGEACYGVYDECMKDGGLH